MKRVKENERTHRVLDVILLLICFHLDGIVTEHIINYTNNQRSVLTCIIRIQQATITSPKHHNSFTSTLRSVSILRKC